ncbi:Gfo/Idh/MocA family protein [Candidatus Entotheonella palauensis]|uniref:Gfo/Idh/MocA family protein n=1 Tax=Candidatus Entotheonella palauensis TaxID=93172 RepID=UPI0015C4CD02|nr:Gfo/Idh/MocA family oxidoreductase [Candidatus Entotheonella palauensis]
MTYRFGIVGAGMIAPYHYAAINDLTNARVVGIMDNGSGRGRDIAPELNATGANDIDGFLAREDIDVITIATPSGAHLETAVKAAQAGKHCIVEKPIEITLERIDAMIAAHDQAGTRLGGIFNTRYTDAAQLVKRTVEAGRLGRLTFASALGPWWRDQSYYDTSDWKGTWALDGGGATMNQGIHSVDQLQWIVGSPVIRVNANIATLAHERVEVEDTASASIMFANGALGTIACTTSMWPGHFRSITVAGDAGTIVLADDRLLVWQFRDERPEDDGIRAKYLALPSGGAGASNPSAGVTADGHRAVFADFLAALDRGEAPAIDGHESRKAVSIIRAIYDSAERGGAPVVPG